MRKQSGYLIAGALGAVVLTVSVAAGYVQDGIDERSSETTAIGKQLTERQALERRRARVADVAIAGTTVQ